MLAADVRSLRAGLCSLSIPMICPSMNWQTPSVRLHERRTSTQIWRRVRLSGQSERRSLAGQLNLFEGHQAGIETRP